MEFVRLKPVKRSVTFMYQDPYYLYSHAYYPTYNLKHETLGAIGYVVKHGLKEAKMISYEHALKEAAAISYLMGKGYNYTTAHQIVESWWRSEEWGHWGS
jgi:hypothetical protein